MYPFVYLLDFLAVNAGGLLGSSRSGVTQLLERCAFKAVLQLSRFSDVKLPPLRLKLTLPVLHFHLSPARLQRVMRVINAAVPSACPLCCLLLFLCPRPLLQFSFVSGGISLVGEGNLE